MSATNDTGITITETQFLQLKDAVSKEDYTRYHELKSQFGSSLSTLYIPGPTGQGLFGTLSHQYTKEHIGEKTFLEKQTEISKQIAGNELRFIEQTRQGGAYSLPSITKTLQLEIKSWAELGFPANSYAGIFLDKLIDAGASDLEISVEDYMKMVVASAKAAYEQATGDQITYKGKDYSKEILTERDGIYYAQGKNGKIPVGITEKQMFLSLRATAYASFIEQNPEIFLSKKSSFKDSKGRIRDAGGLRKLFEKILGKEGYDRIIESQKLNRRYDEEGKLTYREEWKKDGTHTEEYLDPSDAADWKSEKTAYDKDGKRVSKTVINDDGTRAEYRFDKKDKPQLERKYNAKGKVTWDREAEAQKKAEADRLAGEAAERHRKAMEEQRKAREDADRQLRERQRQDAIERQKEADARHKRILEQQAADQAERDRRIRESESHRVIGSWNKNPTGIIPIPIPRPPFETKPTWMISPVLLDLDMDGHIDLRPFDPSEFDDLAGPRFDWDGDGTPDATGWVGPGDGWLAIDLAPDGGTGPDGVIDQARELAFTLWKTPDELAAEQREITDLEALRQVFDTNGNNQLDPGDARWSEFRIWQDANQNGVTESGELRTLTEADIRLIELMPSLDGIQQFSDGSMITGTSSFVKGDGTRSLVGDVTIAYRPGKEMALL
jgi:hypothetical protein